MPTVFERVKLCCNSNNIPLPSKDQKIIIGKEIADYYVNNKQLFPFPLRRKSQVEDTGTFTVISYPKVFLPVMDSIVFKHLFAKIIDPVLPANKPDIKTKRKRIPLKVKVNFYPKPQQTSTNAS